MILKGYSEPHNKKATAGRVTQQGVINVEAAITPKQAYQSQVILGSGAQVSAQSSNASKNARKKAKKKARLETGSRDKTPVTPIVVDTD
jgi:hypothetical protein